MGADDIRIAKIENNYNLYLNTHFIEKHRALFQRAIDWRKEIVLPAMDDGAGNFYRHLLGQIEEKFGFNMQKQCQVNFAFLVLWQRYLKIPKINENLYMALDFIILCCVMDKFLDSRRYSTKEKNLAIRKVWKEYDAEKNDENVFTEFKRLYAGSVVKLRGCLKSCNDTLEANMILEKVRKAFLSEDYIWRVTLDDCDTISAQKFHLLTDKSVEFESSALCMAGMGYLSKEGIQAASLIGEICWLADDLFDLEEDIQENRVNSLLYIWDLQKSGENEREEGIKSEKTKEERIKQTYGKAGLFIQMLNSRIDSLEKLENRNLFYFVVNLIWEWGSKCIKSHDKRI